MAENSTTPPPYGGPQTGLSGRGTRFFDWMRSLGVVRAEGWVGGVCAGVAHRIGIDPLIVRGIVVVAALLGAPVVLLYALAWAFLPDLDGSIHVQRLFEGEVRPPIVAIGVLVLLSLLPWRSDLWPFGVVPDRGGVVGGIIWTLIVLGAIVALIVMSTRYADRRQRMDGTPSASPMAAAPPTAPTPPAPSTATDAAFSAAATTASDPDGVSTDTNATASVPAPAPALDMTAEPAAPPAPSAAATEQDLAEWRSRQAQWKADHAEWKRRLTADMRAVKAQRSAEIRAQSASAAAEAAARRAAYRAANPRIGAAVGWLAVGLAIVAGALTAALWNTIGLPRYTPAATLAAATLVFGVTVLIAGFSRRRSGFLIFLGILLATLTAVSIAVSDLLTYDTTQLFDSARSSGQILSPTGNVDDLRGTGTTVIRLSETVDRVAIDRVTK